MRIPSSTRLLLHATARRSLASILRHGLLCARSRGKKPVVWLHTASKSAWAMLHVVKRHRGLVESVVILEVEVSRRELRRHSRRVWYSTADIPPSRIRGVIGFGELTASPVDTLVAG
jgi:RNA:NAD 2'-phosphotransferase (TPT1/KptA family)